MKFIKLLCYVIFVVGFLAFGQSQSKINIQKPILSLNFDEDIDSKEVKSVLKIINIEVAPGAGVNGTTGIKVNYVGYDKGSMRMVKSISLPKSYNEATLNYAVKFDEAFQFPITGKLHGLGPVNKVTGGNPMRPDGWSARITFANNGLKPYVYHQHLKGQYGEGKKAPEFHFEKGVYYDLAIYVKVNTPASSRNGIVEIYANGKKIVEYTALQLTAIDGEDTEINDFLFSTFHGGSSPKYSPIDSEGNYTTVVAWFDDFEVYEGHYVRAAKI
jgi:hypothetical protein